MPMRRRIPILWLRVQRATPGPRQTGHRIPEILIRDVTGGEHLALKFISDRQVHHKKASQDVASRGWGKLRGWSR